MKNKIIEIPKEHFAEFVDVLFSALLHIDSKTISTDMKIIIQNIIVDAVESKEVLVVDNKIVDSKEFLKEDNK